MSQQVLNPGIDPTSYVAITGAELAEMVSGATFASNVGGVIVTLDVSGVPVVPQAQTDATLQTYIWIRIGTPSSSGNFATPYVWNPNLPNAVGALLNWNTVASSSIASGSIQGYMIASNTIPATALIGGITLSQVTFANLISSAINTSTQFTGSISGTLASGLSIAVGAINSITQFGIGCISNNTPFSGQVVEPYNICTDTSTANNQVLMAVSGSGGVPTWVSKAILGMADPGAGTDAGYIPVYQSNGTYSLESPASAVGSTTFSSVGTVAVTGITITAATFSSKTYTITVSSALPSSTPGVTFPVSFSGGTAGCTALNGSWTATVVNSTSFTVVVTGTPSGATTSGYWPTKSCYFSVNTDTLNIASVTSPGVTIPGEVQVNFSANYSNTNFLVFASIVDSVTTDCITTKIMNKAVGSITLGFFSVSANTMIALPAGMIHVTCI